MKPQAIAPRDFVKLLCVVCSFVLISLYVEAPTNLRFSRRPDG